MNLVNVIIKPIYTEKTYALKLGDQKKYAFEVSKDSNKKTIELAFKMIYNILPEKINIVVRKPSSIRNGTKTPGFSKYKKIAYITLPKGYDIEIVEKEEKKSSTTKEGKKEK